MKHHLSFSTILALCSCSSIGLAEVTSSSQGQYPVGIIHPNEIFVQEIASRMFNLMPEQDKIKIAQANGIGSDGFDPFATTHQEAATNRIDIPSDITASEYLKMIVSEPLAERMTTEQWNILNSIASTIDGGNLVPHMCFAPDMDREYAFAINQLIEFPLNNRFQQIGRWSTTATDGGGLSQGDPTTLTYSFVPDGTLVVNSGIGLGSGNSQIFSWLNGIYGNPNVWQPLFTQVFDRWAEITGLSYVFEPNDDGTDTNTLPGQLGVRGDVRIAAFDFQNDGNGGTLAYNSFPNDGDMIFDAFDTFYNQTFSDSIRLRNVISHEHGHGLGMLHVCPVNQTKLMEPFISVSFDGPQLDETLNGIRHYGDFAEPNNSIALATDLGTFGVGSSSTLTNLGVDDNSDRDIFRITVTESSRIIFSVSPDADEYVQGPQTGNCDTGALTDYESIHDLKITATLTNGFPIQSENSTSFGTAETMVFDADAPGDYFFVVEGATNVNSVQRYRLALLFIDIPFRAPSIEADAPESVAPGVTNDFLVTIDPRDDTVEADSELIFVSINGAPFASSQMVDNGNNEYTASIPAANCGDSVEYYISVQGESGGEITFPENGESNPLTTFVGSFIDVLNDDFQSDLGWAVSGDADNRTIGAWERGDPRGDGSRADAPEDADGSGSCYLTGNGSAGSNTDVDNGDTILTSPAFDVSNIQDPTISYYRWFHNSFGQNPNVEIFQVEISDDNGNSWSNLETVTGNSPESNGGWFQKSFRIADFVNTTSQVRVRFIAQDISGAVVEAGVDGIEISGQTCEDVASCPADLNNDGVLDFFDVGDFLNAFANEDPIADFSGDGVFDFFDVGDFLSAFAAGCP